MKKISKRVVCYFSSALLITIVFSPFIESAYAYEKVEENPPQLTGTDSIEEVVEAMTTEEKAALLVGGNKEVLEEEFNEIIGGQSTKVPGAAGQTQEIPRLGIPSIVLADGPMGVRIDSERENDNNSYYATKFPSPNVLASTWNKDLVTDVGEATSNELKAYGIDLLLAPGMNIQSYLLNGRNYEYFSEDPIVTGEMATAFVNGVQEQGIGTTIKHFAAYNQRADNNIDAVVSQRALREIYLKGFEMTVRDASPWAIMDSYNKLNGTWATENEELLKGVLRDDWGFSGIAMTDWEFGDRDIEEQMRAGTNLLMPGREEQVQGIFEAVNGGGLEEKVLNNNVKEMLGIIVQTPTFKRETPSNNPDLGEGAAISRKAAAEGMVLLQNNDKTLPIDSSHSISVFGTPQVETKTGGRGSALVEAPYEVGVPEGLERAGYQLNSDLFEKYEQYVEELRGTEEYEQTDGDFFSATYPTLPEMDVTEEAISAADKTDAAVIVLSSEFGSYGSDRSKEDYYLTETEREMITNVSKAYHDQGKKVIAVLNTEGPVETNSWSEHVDGIILSWQPGQEFGNALGDVLTGDVNPSGKLPQTFPVDYEDLPYADRYPGDGQFVYEEDIYTGYRYHTTFDLSSEYEFGYGLSYTTFDYEKAEIIGDGFTDNKIEVSATLRNSGDENGREAVQVYVSAPDGKLEKPELELKSFDKTENLEPGESEELTFSIDEKTLASFDEDSSSWIIEPGSYSIKVGASSKQIHHEMEFEIDEEIVVETVNNVLSPESPKKTDNTFIWPEKTNEYLTFKDISDQFWAKNAIEDLASREVIKGYAYDNTFRPNDPVRRGQLIAMIGRLLDWNTTETETEFDDVAQDYFASPFISYASNKGYIKGFQDGSFRPNEPITRGQMAKILGKAFDLPTEETDINYADVDLDMTGGATISYLSRHDIVNGYENNKFRPGSELTRAQFAEVLYNLGNHLEQLQ